jgi:hypothetical protein
MKRQLQVRIYSDGTVAAKTLGIYGEECTNHIKTLEHLLNAQVVESAFTDEYYQVQQQEMSETTIDEKL